MAPDLTRKSKFAGSFYPGSAGEIRKTLDVLRERAGEQAWDRHPPILIVPHAGWIYSGLAAVRGLATLVGSQPSRAVLIGPAHRHYFLGFSISGYDGYETPLGRIPVDLQLQRTICDQTGFEFVEEAHEVEHSLEVIIPMIQYMLPGVKAILPILAGSVSRASIDMLADALAGLLDPMSDVVLVSTDLSHFYGYNEARDLDAETLNLITGGAGEALLERSGEGGRLACGYAGVVVAIGLARRWDLGKPELLIYYNSGDSGGDRNSVVGYASVAYRPPDLGGV